MICTLLQDYTDEIFDTGGQGVMGNLKSYNHENIYLSPNIASKNVKQAFNYKLGGIRE